MITEQPLTSPVSAISEGEFFLVASAPTFEELKKIMPNYVIPHGGKIRFEFQLNMPVAYLFDLAGAEHIFRSSMPPGLDLIDVWGEGSSTVVIEAESDPVALAVVGTYLLAHWLKLSLIAIGLTVAFGFLFTSVAILATAVTAPEVIPKTTMWLALGAASIAVIGLIAFKGKPTRARAKGA